MHGVGWDTDAVHQSLDKGFHGRIGFKNKHQPVILDTHAHTDAGGKHFHIRLFAALPDNHTPSTGRGKQHDIHPEAAEHGITGGLFQKFFSVWNLTVKVRQYGIYLLVNFGP